MGTATTRSSAPDVSGTSPAPAGSPSLGSGSADPRPGGGAGTTGPAGTRGAAGGGVRTTLPAEAGACRLLTGDVAAGVLAPQDLARSADVDNVCAYTAADGSTLVDIGDLPLAQGQSASRVLAGELSNRDRSGYRASRVIVGSVTAVLEDGRPHVAQLVWVQRGRVLTLTVSPAGSSSTTRVLRAGATISSRFG